MDIEEVKEAVNNLNNEDLEEVLSYCDSLLSARELD